MNRRSLQLSFDTTKTYSAENRINLVRIDNLKRPGAYEFADFTADGFDELVERLKRLKRAVTRSYSLWVHTLSSADCHLTLLNLWKPVI